MLFTTTVNHSYKSTEQLYSNISKVTKFLQHLKHILSQTHGPGPDPNYFKGGVRGKKIWYEVNIFFLVFLLFVLSFFDFFQNSHGDCNGRNPPPPYHHHHPGSAHAVALILTSVFWYAVTAMNCVSGKAWVCRLFCSFGPCDPTSITWIRGWYLCMEFRTI